MFNRDEFNRIAIRVSQDLWLTMPTIGIVSRTARKPRSIVDVIFSPGLQ